MPVVSSIAILAGLWIVSFFVFLFPARWLGRWIAKQTTNSLIGIIYCFALSQLLVVWVAVLLVFAQLPFLPHVNQNTGGFGIGIVDVFFFVPALVALLVGFRRAVARVSHLQSAA